MENSAKVFYSNITNSGCRHKNNLYDLLNIVPAKPIEINDIKIYTCDYRPKTGKNYIQKKKSRLKVRTVRDIRKSFEQDVYSHLRPDLEKQENILLQKIKRGSLRNETKLFATKILRGDTPISWSTWQILINLNPEHQKYPRRFVLWNGKFIKVNGSYGGMKKKICSYDLASTPQCLPTPNHKDICLKQHEGNIKKGLLRNSLAVKFKPGPLCKKPFLDDSYQKDHISNVELINLPKHGLDVQPEYGTAFESSTTQFINNLSKEDGTISQKWAEFAVSVLGTVQNSKAVQLNRDCVTFDLAYKHNQNRLLVRRDLDHGCNTSEVIDTGTIFKDPRTIEINAQLEIEDVVHKIIDAVEINLSQDTIFTKEPELKTFPCKDLDFVTHIKDKTKRKFGKLDDVTVITLPKPEEHNSPKSCSKMNCSFGCICASLEGTYNLKEHCGRVECMFKCTCDFSTYKSDLSYTGCTEKSPGLLSIENAMNFNLAKQEQKSHQTVIVTREKKNLLKAGTRNCKTSNIYADFSSNMSIEHEKLKTRNFSIVALKLNCDNVEPWCMVHELYKCFCKGKFTDTCTPVSKGILGKEPLSKDSLSNVGCLENSKVTNDVSNIEEFIRRKGTNSVKKSKISDNTHNKPNKIHTSRSMDKTTNTNKITKNLNNIDLEDEIQINILVKDAETVLSGSSDIINMNAEKGMLTRHVRKLNTQKYSNNHNHENTSDLESSGYLKVWNSKSMSNSRTSAYEGRKYSNDYYKNINYKISTLEKSDKILQERLTFLYNKSKCCEEDTIIKPSSKTKEPACLLQLLYDTNENGEDLTPKSKRRCLSIDTDLVTWLESNYKMYKQRNDSDLLKNALEPPQHGKLALYSWGFILKRYRERKNHFLVFRQPPFRIFLAVNTENPFFENCIDINDIRFADLHKYPTTIKNLIINATELKDTFCMLRGLAFCWELIASVNKVNERSEHAEKEGTPEMYIESSVMETDVFNQGNSEVNNLLFANTFIQGNSDVNNLLFENTEQTEPVSVFNHNSFIENTEQKDLDKISAFNENNSAVKKSLVENIQQNHIISNSEKEFESSTGCSNDTGLSKWFVMTIENDFSEIRFFRKGFFIKHHNIIHAIKVARVSQKTVRLTSMKFMQQLEAPPPFGMYAIPYDNEYCVFVGPYEMEDTLGIETIETILDVRKLKRTRGFWITTNKIDNLKMVDNPLSFARINIRNNNLPLETLYCANDVVNKDQQEKPDMHECLHINKPEESKSTLEKSPVRIVKIRKTSGLYHKASHGVLKKTYFQKPHKTTKAMPVVLKTSLNIEDNSAKPLLKPIGISNDLYRNQIPETSQEPFAEASSSTASQIEISAVFPTQNDDTMAKHTNRGGGMFILKPDGINRKLVQNKLTKNTLSSTDQYNSNDGTTHLGLLPSGLENVRSMSDAEWCSLTSDTTVNSKIWTDIWIQCKNNPNLGWIAGIKNLDNLLSFKIPGCAYSEFYPEEEAFTKINSELRKRINGSNDLELQWTVHESIGQLQGKEMNPEHLYPDNVGD